MKCPKCEHNQEDNRFECERCGVIFAKAIRALENDAIPKERKNTPPSKDKDSIHLSDLLFAVKEENNILFFIGRCALFTVLVWWTVLFLLNPLDGDHLGVRIMHMINLPFHEAGHVFLRPFGHFLMSLGGTLGQLLMPLICCSALLFKTRDTFGAAVAFWWFGQNFFDIAPYINDARSLSLPLVGGNFGHSSPYGFHDWEYLLTETGMLQYDHTLAVLSGLTGSLLLILSCCWGGFLLLKQLMELR